jgi:hypothetical protein
MKRERRRVLQIARGVAAAALLVTALTLSFLRAFGPGPSPIAGPIDFLAFDCAGQVAAERADPYLIEPLRSCEAAAAAESGSHVLKYLVVPAPLPPYALAAFALFAKLPFREASALWLALCIVAVLATIVLVREVTHAPLVAIAVVIIAAVGGSSLAIGQIVPIVICALCGSALALRADRPRLAAALALPLLLAPTVGVPVAIALFAWEPRARATLVTGLLAAGVLSLLFGGVGRNLEYVQQVLPAQARAEGLEFGGQYSLTALLAVLGFPAPLALALGALMYAVMIVLGVSFGRRIAGALHERSAIVLFPAAFAVIGGSYVHIHQIAFVLPALFLLIGRTSRLRALTFTALVVLAIPWEMLEEIPGLLPAHPQAHQNRVFAELARASRPGELAEIPWGIWVRSGHQDSRTTLERFECKLPTWTGLILFVAATSLIVFREPGAPREMVPLLAS